MRITELSISQLEGAVRAAFEGDAELLSLYDPGVKVGSIEAVVKDVVRKIKEYEDVAAYGLYFNQDWVGYFVCLREEDCDCQLLISFGLAKRFRSPRHLKQFYRLMRDKMKPSFACALWNSNERAIQWLRRCGMKIVERNDRFTALKN